MSKKKTLIIVESPSKCKKIEQYLGRDYKVVASYGHFTKLDSLDQIQFDTFQIQYKVDKGKVLKTIKEEIKKSKEVILATDDDREGEAIAWSLCVFCKLPVQTTKKMIFQEITKPALTRALENITTINMDRVRSQQSRQILDIYLGYTISPLLWKYVQHKLSAGRCQTPTLKLIYENQQECDSLSNDTHYIVKAVFTSKRIPFQCSGPISKDTIETYMELLSHKKDWTLESKKERQVTENPPRVLITSTLQQKAHQLFKYSPKMTMKYAQELYENGLITYMRTDSACYSLEFIESVKKHIVQQHGDVYLHKNIYGLQQNKNKSKAQEAHEGIRICDIQKTEANVKTSGANTLYKFIYKHSIQCAMSPATFHETQYNTSILMDTTFKHTNKTPIFLGWKILDKESSVLSFVSYLTHLYDSKTTLSLPFAEANECLAQTKSHYHEASLIQKLESLNIGRPSTYASILQSVLDKKYVLKGNIEGKAVSSTQFVFLLEEGVQQKKEEKILHQEKNKLAITPLGKQVCEFCYGHFDEVFQYEFTNKMEQELDEIEGGSLSQEKVLNPYIQIVSSWIEKTKQHYHENPEEVKKVKDQSIHCGTYQNEPLFIKNGKFGYYLSIGKKDKISLKEFKGFSVEQKIKDQTEMKENEKQALIDYMEQRKVIRNENICVELTPSCSIRKSKYGYYIFYQKKGMKKPQFLKYNDEKDEEKDTRLSWIETKDKSQISAYITKKYNISI